MINNNIIIIITILIKIISKLINCTIIQYYNIKYYNILIFKKNEKRIYIYQLLYINIVNI